MITSVGIHDVTKMEAIAVERYSWLRIETKGGSYVAVFIPLDVAQRIVAAFEGHPEEDPEAAKRFAQLEDEDAERDAYIDELEEMVADPS